LKQDTNVPFRRTLGLTLGALGVVFGDIGTSPLYAMRETALAAGGHAARPGIGLWRPVADLLGAGGWW
jgi:K+ transporter